MARGYGGGMADHEDWAPGDVSAEIILTSKELAAQTAQLLEVTVSIRADAHGAVPAEVRRARSAPGF